MVVTKMINAKNALRTRNSQENQPFTEPTSGQKEMANGLMVATLLSTDTVRESNMK